MECDPGDITKRDSEEMGGRIVLFLLELLLKLTHQLGLSRGKSIMQLLCVQWGCLQACGALCVTVCVCVSVCVLCRILPLRCQFEPVQPA